MRCATRAASSAAAVIAITGWSWRDREPRRRGRPPGGAGRPCVCRHPWRFTRPAQARQPDGRGLLDFSLGWNADFEHRRRSRPRTRGHPVGRDVAGRTAGRLRGSDALRGDPRRQVDVDLEGVAGEIGVLVQAAEPLQLCETPDLLAAGRDRVVLDLEGALRVEVAGDLAGLDRLGDSRGVGHSHWFRFPLVSTGSTGAGRPVSDR